MAAFLIVYCVVDIVFHVKIYKQLKNFYMLLK